LSEPKRTDPAIHRLSEKPRTVRFSVLYRGHRFELPPGTLTIGRGAGCQLVLDDALVSRKHAEIEVATGSAQLVDLGSVNGVFVNGDRVEGRRALGDGDRVVIGQQELVIYASAAPSLLPESPTARLSADTLVGIDTSGLVVPPREGDSESTHQGDALELLGNVVDKVLVLGRGEEAERIIGSYLKNYLATVKKAGSAEASAAERSVGYAVKLAAATKKPAWIDYGFEMYSVLKRPLPAAIVDQLYTVLRQVPGINLGLLRDYVAILRQASARLGPADRFLAQRIEGLERLASA
jgi:FHA domain